MSRGVIASLVVSLFALGVAGASAISSGFSGVFQQQLATPQGTGFTFQGRIEQDGVPHTGSCDLQFALFEDAVASAQVGSAETIASPVTVTNGLFSVIVNSTGAFGNEAFSGDARWLQTAVRCPAGSGSFTTLAPLTELTPVPYATFAMDSASLGGFPAEEYARFERVIVVNGGGTNAENGARLVAAMAEAALITPGRVLLLLEPGTFQLAAPLAVNANTDIAGAPGGASTITNTAGQPTLQTVSGTVLTNLRVTGASGTGTVVEHSTGRLDLERVTITGSNAGFILRSQAPSPSADIFLDESSLVGTCFTGTCVGLKGAGISRFYLTDSDVSIQGIGAAIFVSAIQTENYLSVSGGFVTASGSSAGQGAVTIDGTGSSAVFFIERTTISAQGAGGLIVLRSNGSVSVNQSTISAFGGSGLINVGLDISAALTMRDSHVSVSGATQRVAVYLKSGNSSLIERSFVQGLGADVGSPAIQVAGFGFLEVMHSHVESPTSSMPIFVQEGSATVAHTSLHGMPIAAALGATIDCAATTDEALDFFVDMCP